MSRLTHLTMPESIDDDPPIAELLRPNGYATAVPMGARPPEVEPGARRPTPSELRRKAEARARRIEREAREADEYRRACTARWKEMNVVRLAIAANPAAGFVDTTGAA